MQPAGKDEATVRVCVPLGWHAPHAEYVKLVHVVGAPTPGEIAAAHVGRPVGGSDGDQTGPHE